MKINFVPDRTFYEINNYLCIVLVYGETPKRYDCGKYELKF